MEMQMSIEIRAGRSGDEGRLAVLNGYVHELHVARRPDHFKATELADVAVWFGAVLGNPDARIWIAEQGDEAVGYLVALLHRRSENPFCHPRRWCELDHVAVAEGSRKQGVARALVEHAIADVRADGIFDVEVSSWSFNNDAQRTFERLGFVPKVVRFELARMERSEAAQQPVAADDVGPASPSRPRR
jgi:ribosomal protein S18 acetylase RimI-like enzyme